MVATDLSTQILNDDVIELNIKFQKLDVDMCELILSTGCWDIHTFTHHCGVAVTVQSVR